MASRVEMGLVSMCSRESLQQLMRGIDGKRATLMGLGLFGGGAGAARFLATCGANLLVTDLRPGEKLAPSMHLLDGLPITYRLGEHFEQDFIDTDLLVANPAVPRNNRFLRAAERAGVPITSPMNLFLSLCPAPVAAVTGSNGKSTTTSLLARMVACSGRRVWLGGNIGISLLPLMDRIRPGDLVVLEMSSFMLEDAEALRWSPHLAVATNLTPNHLDRHRDFGAYAAAKRVIFDYQSPEDVAVLNARDATLMRWSEDDLGGRLFFFDSAPDPANLRAGVSLVNDRLVWHAEDRDELICRRDEVPLVGPHNAENAMAATVAAVCLGARGEHVRAALKRFVGLEHRLEPVGEYGGLRFYNDSDSTTPESGIAALHSFPGPVTLIAGGYDKKLDLGPFARAAAGVADVIITMGQTGPVLARMARQESAYLGKAVVIEEVATLEEALACVKQLSMPGSSVIFSPSCPSYDSFDNFRHRGEVFKALVRSHFGDDALSHRCA